MPRTFFGFKSFPPPSGGAVSLVSIVLLVASAVTGCAALNQQSTVAQGPDGSYKLTCRTTLPRCLDRAEEICGGNRYVVLRAVDHHDYMGSQSTVGESQVRSSEALFVCGKRGKSFWGPDADPMTAQMTAPTTSPAPAPPASTLCVPGATQACTGPAACRGGQACLGDGSGYSRCDCGGADSAAGTGGVSASPSPAETPAPAQRNGAAPGAAVSAPSSPPPPVPASPPTSSPSPTRPPASPSARP